MDRDEAPSGPGLFRVLLRLTAPAAVAEQDLSHVRQLLADSPGRPPVEMSLAPDRHEVRLYLGVVAEDAHAAGRRAVDAVRALLGADARSARWIVDARRVEVGAGWPEQAWPDADRGKG